MPTPDFSAIKLKQQATWAAGDYSQIGSRIQIVGERLCEAMDIRSGWRVLDVAAGNGNASLAAARCFCDVTSTDYVPELLERGKARAEADGLAIKFQVADAENLPFADGEFDAVMSTFGVMFAPDQARASAEMFRVLKPGGIIGLACWTPRGFPGQTFKVISKFITPPPGLTPPVLWGTEARLHELFPAAKSIQAEARVCNFRYLSPTHWLQLFRTYFGPMNKAFASLDEAGQCALEADFIALASDMNLANDGTLVLPSEYLEIVITK